jgi:hypothetical protein
LKMSDFSTALMRLWPHGDEKIPRYPHNLTA